MAMNATSVNKQQKGTHQNIIYTIIQNVDPILRNGTKENVIHQVKCLNIIF
jgi:hypothetical protein